MSNSTRDRIAAAFDRELAENPVPPSLRTLAIREAVAAPRQRSNQPQLLVLVAAILVVAVVATLVIGSHLLQSKPIPAGSTVPPPPRANASAAYDQAHGVLVVFGGNTGPNPPVNETWTWDGKHWTRLHPAVGPSARFGAAMAYDSARHDIVLFGGTEQVKGKVGTTTVAETWAWDGSSWHEKHPLHAPAIGYEWQGPSMQFDPITRTVLLFGFTTNSGSGGGYQPQTWSWNGSDWTQLSPATTPTSPGTMLVSGRQVLLLAGSPGLVGGRYLTQTWAWNGSSWIVLNPKVNLPLLGTASGAYDPMRGQLVVLTGDTWTWDGSSWSRQHPTLQPVTVGYAAYIESLHEVVSWGDVNSSVDNEMFGWTGSDWKLLDPGTVQAGLSNGGKGYLGVMSPDQAATTIRSTVKNTQPVILPTSLPGGPYDATVRADADGFNIDYQSDLRDKRISFGIVVANPPPGGPGSSDTRVKFRNAIPLKYSQPGYAQYFVYDPTAPLSNRWLMWIEPGTMTNAQIAGPGVPYFLSASGLTDQEFWQVANSLK